MTVSSPAASLPDNISNLIDEQHLAKMLDNHPDDALKELKSSVNITNDGLQKAYEAGAPVEDIVYGRANLIDRLLVTLFDHLFKNSRQVVCLIAVGGYGRGELHPKSDIDLMLLLKDEENDQTKSAIEKYLTLLWDSKLEIGHSVRTISECVDESTNDITVATNLMESRLLSGDTDLFEQMKVLTGPEHIWKDEDFFQAKLDEQIQRNGKFNDTAYNLEPNIKEGHGGLRDIQMVGWVAKRHFGATHMQDLVEKKFLRQDEIDTLHEGQHLLWRIRCSLHYLSGRREDRLLFDYQRQLAHEFGYEDGDNTNNHAIEQFMQQYYRTVMELERLNEMLLQLFREAILYANKQDEPSVINDYFQVRHGYIEARDDNLFKKRPVALLELFYIMQQHPDLQGVRAETIRLVREHKHLIDDDFRETTEAKKIFMKIIRQGRGITHELRRMNRYGILAAYIPAFESIVGRMQYDLFHAYTVDQHTLFVVRNLRRFSVPEFCNEFPLASGITRHLKNPELLYLAGLFHDIAKGRNGDHSELGAVDALEFCQNHGLNQADSELVSWLVRNHLIMSMIAQRKDISDPGVIAEFTAMITDIEHLDYLYLLTVADIRGTNPKQWNSWKDKLLAELYHKTAELLHKGIEHQLDRQDLILSNQTDALRLLDLRGLSTYQVHAIWGNFNDEYFLRHNPGEIFWHTQLIHENKNGNKPLISSRLNSNTGSLELIVYTKLDDNIFSITADILRKMSLNVVNAQVMQCKNGFLLDTFKIISGDGNLQHIKNSAHEVVPRLQDILSGKTASVSSASSATSRQHKHFDVKTEITFEPDRDDNTTGIHITTTDQPGLLALIAKVFIDCDIRIHSASISTAGEKAIDYFDISNKINHSALSHETQKRLKSSLLKQL